MDDLLSAARFIDSDAPAIGVFANEVTAGIDDEKDKVLRLYHAIRDDIVYDPYVNFSDPSNFRASDVLANGRGFCIGKAALLAAATRAIGMPARVGYADVRNHLTSRRLYERIKTDIFIWHSYADLHVCGRWVKATPAFDLGAVRAASGSSRWSSMARTIRCSIRSIARAAATWNICGIAAPSRMCRSRPSKRLSSTPTRAS